jgi:hypothetical protein
VIAVRVTITGQEKATPNGSMSVATGADDTPTEKSVLVADEGIVVLLTGMRTNVRAASRSRARRRGSDPDSRSHRSDLTGVQTERVSRDIPAWIQLRASETLERQRPRRCANARAVSRPLGTLRRIGIRYRLVLQSESLGTSPSQSHP